MENGRLRSDCAAAQAEQSLPGFTKHFMPKLPLLFFILLPAVVSSCVSIIIRQFGCIGIGRNLRVYILSTDTGILHKLIMNNWRFTILVCNKMALTI